MDLMQQTLEFVLAEAVPGLKSLVIGYPKPLDREYVKANGSAVSSQGKIMQFHRERLDVAKASLLISSFQINGKRSLCALPNGFTFLREFLLRLFFLD
ncbi:hypothetical protein OIU76_029481 [Salix suchowensis]|nr:hypothetical protein OIU76_029481 [Salix suchowensis]